MRCFDCAKLFHCKKEGIIQNANGPICGGFDDYWVKIAHDVKPIYQVVTIYNQVTSSEW